MVFNFESGRGVIEVTISGSGNGSAYFKMDDMGADITNGEFKHPMWETHYRVLFPLRGNYKHQTTLQVMEWRSVDAKLPEKS